MPCGHRAQAQQKWGSPSPPHHTLHLRQQAHPDFFYLQSSVSDDCIREALWKSSMAKYMWGSCLVPAF